MEHKPRASVIRARQRSRTILKAFSNPLLPQLHEVGIDKMQVSVTGRWEFRENAQRSVAAYRDALMSLQERAHWFRRPEWRRTGTIIVRTVQDCRANIGPARIVIDGLLGTSGTYMVSLTCNPTETLAHRIADWGREPDFIARVTDASPFAFFGIFGVPPSLDVKQNWLPDVDLATELFGPDIFEAFFPIFCDQVMKLVAHILSPFDRYTGPILSDDGTDQIFHQEELTGRLEWGKARVPQIETYIERYHSKAIDAVRSCAQAALNALDNARVRHHLNRVAFERQEAAFSIRSQLPADRDLSVYAKSADRIRFEVGRPRRGRYGPMLLNAPADRLLQIFRSERTDFLEACDWDAVAGLFQEPPHPTASDLVRLVTAVAEVCRDLGAPSGPVFSALLTDGGVRAGLPGISPDLIKRLERSGVIERTKLRRRNQRGELRYALSQDYMALLTEIMSTLNPD